MIEVAVLQCRKRKVGRTMGKNGRSMGEKHGNHCIKDVDLIDLVFMVDFFVIIGRIQDGWMRHCIQFAVLGHLHSTHQS